MLDAPQPNHENYPIYVSYSFVAINKMTKDIKLGLSHSQTSRNDEIES